MKIKTSDLTGAALDWAVTQIEKPEACEYGVADWMGQRSKTVKDGEYVYRWHQSWAQGGPIIERQEIALTLGNEQAHWGASTFAANGRQDRFVHGFGHTPLVAAMRAFVASKLGDEVEIPEELT